MKNAIKLSYTNNLDLSLQSSRNLIQVIIGPRQVGKTTTTLNYLESHHKGRYSYVSADEVFDPSPEWLTEQWHKAYENKKILVVDEIQKSHNWSNTVKGLWDKAKRNDTQVKCILLGSSSLQIQKGLTESLTGRFLLHPVYHWNYSESKKGYSLNLEEYLKFGGYPGSYEYISSAEWVNYVKNSIVSTVIEKDILLYNTVKSPSLFKQAFEILSSYPAQEISYTKLLGQLQDRGNVDLIKYYIQLYEGAFLIKALEKFSNKKIKTKASSPKILPLAPSLYYLSILDAYTPTEKGRAFELIVGAQLLRTGSELYYWREGNFEVDYVLKHGKHIWGIEVKSGRDKKASGITKFQEHFPTSKVVLITMDNYERFEKDPLGFLQSK